MEEDKWGENINRGVNGSDKIAEERESEREGEVDARTLSQGWWVCMFFCVYLKGVWDFMNKT